MASGRQLLDIVLVVPWYGGSHRSWADGLAASSNHRIRMVTLPAEHWRWRFQGGPVTLATALVEDFRDNDRPDLVIVSSMTDIAGLLGIARNALAGVGVIAYRHESQLLYPSSPRQRKEPIDEAASLAEWRAMIAVDHTWFNSSFHLDTYFEALPRLLDRPTRPGHTHLIDEARAKCSVLPVGVRMDDLTYRAVSRCDEPLLLFNQRWDHDKGVRRVIAALEKLAAEGLGFRVAFVGARAPSSVLPTFSPALSRLVTVNQELDRASYVDLLTESDIVVSDATHEFFGIAAIEAMASGCLPMFPDRQNYPNLVGDRRRFLHSGHDLSARLAALIEQIRSGACGLATETAEVAADVARFDAGHVGAQFDSFVDSFIGDQR